MKRKFPDVYDALSRGQYLTRHRLHPHYEVYMGTTVAWLRLQARQLGYRKWYCLKKRALVDMLVMDESARVVAKLFRKRMAQKRIRVIRVRVAEGRDNVCPICLTPIEDIPTTDLFVHDDIVFCKEDIVGYISSEFNFTNPITRSDIAKHAIARLGCDSLTEAYGRRRTLRKRAVDSAAHFFFLENDIVRCFKDLLEEVDLSNTEYFREGTFREFYMRFDMKVQQMFDIDSSRTVCVLKDLSKEADGMNTSTSKWSSCLIQKYLNHVSPSAG